MLVHVANPNKYAHGIFTGPDTKPSIAIEGIYLPFAATFDVRAFGLLRLMLALGVLSTVEDKAHHSGARSVNSLLSARFLISRYRKTGVVET